MNQLKLFQEETIIENFSLIGNHARPFKQQLLKWIGNKQRFAQEIISYFPFNINTYFEPFLGSGGVLGVLAPRKGVATDCFKPLVEIWTTLKDEPELLKKWYFDRWKNLDNRDKVEVYEAIKANYNKNSNGADLLFISRVCYGGVVRFRKADGYISTPCGIHKPMPPYNFNLRVDEWHRRVKGTNFYCMEFQECMDMAKKSDLIYCDPPYSDTQSILYGAQNFSLECLFKKIEACKARGVYIALSLDGSKKTGVKLCDLPIPKGLFHNEIFVNCGRSMLRRFQLEGKTLEKEVVEDRLLLTY